MIRSAQLPRGKRALLEQLTAWAKHAQAEEIAATGSIEQESTPTEQAVAVLSQLAKTLDALPEHATPGEWIDECENLARTLGLLQDSSPRQSQGDWETLVGGLHRLGACWQRLESQHAEQTTAEKPHGWSLAEFLSAVQYVATQSNRGESYTTAAGVLVTSAENVRHLQPRHLLLGGLGERAFPAPGQGDSLLSVGELDRLTSDGSAASNADQQRSSDEMLLFYQLVTKPSESLTLSYPALDAKAQPLEPSPYMADLRRAFGEAEVPTTTLPLGELAEVEGQLDELSGSVQRRHAVSALLEGKPRPLVQLAGTSQGKRCSQSILAALEMINSRSQREQFGLWEGLYTSKASQRQFAQQFGTQHFWSPSQLESYAACGFRFAGEQALKLKPLPELTLETDVRRRGSLLHEALATVHEQMLNAPSDTLRTEIVERFIDVLEQIAASQQIYGLPGALREIQRRELAKWGENLAGQTDNYQRMWSDFDQAPQPTHFEVRFGPGSRHADEELESQLSTSEAYELVVPTAAGGEETIRFTGQIDRLDVGRINGQEVFNVIDYKSSKSQKVDLSKLLAGTQLQLPIYALAAEELLMRESNALAWEAGYWSVQGVGFGKTTTKGKHKPQLKMREEVGGKLEATPGWLQAKNQLVERITELIAGIRQADFPVYNDNKDCTKFCSLSTICRIAQIRSLDKKWPPPEEVSPCKRKRGYFMSQTLTTQQQAALDAFDRSVSLAAGAGCGKTFVLTERFLSYVDPCVLEPAAELGQLVAITFTDAAAREMRKRIRERCWSRLLNADSAEEAAAWQKLLRALDGSRISTIHSFCGTLLRNHAVEAGLDPHFEQLEPAAADLLRIETIDDALRTLLIDRDETALDLAVSFGLAPLRGHLMKLIRDTPAAVFEKWRGASATDLIETWQQAYTSQLAPLLMADFIALPELAQLETLCTTISAETDTLRERLADIHATILAAKESTPTEAPLDELCNLAQARPVMAAKNWADPEEYEQYKAACTKVREAIKSTLLGTFTVDQHTEAAAQRGLELFAMADAISQTFTAIKREQNKLEFDDLLELAHRLITDPEHTTIRQRLAKDTRLLMVDEFQDTDPLQVAIVQAFCGEAWREEKLFVVGDFKQSIYGFRGAEPEVSNQLRKELTAEGQLSLTTNFRSQPAILDFVNGLFVDAFGEAYEPLVANRPQVTPEPAIEFLWSPIEEVAAGKKETIDVSREREAHWIARRLVQLLESGEPLVGCKDDPDAARPLELGDIAVLLRSLGDVAVYEEAFRQHGLDYYLAGGHAFYAQQEIYDVLNLLKAVDSVADEIALAGALRSPFFSLQDETLFWLVEKHGSLNEGLYADQLAPEISVTEQAKVHRVGLVLRQLRAQKNETLVAELLLEAIALSGFDASVLSEFLGHRKAANVNKLVEQARTHDRTSPGDLAGFITQLGEFVIRAPKEPLAATQAEGNVIRIMTIHTAKGLEFPLVVIPDLERQAPNLKRDPVFDRQLGPLVKNLDEDGDKYPVGLDLYRYQKKRQEQAERDRVFYVACTRAADFLILSSSVRNLEKPEQDPLQLLATRFDLETGETISPLPGGYATPQIRVITAEPELGGKLVGRTHRTDLGEVLTEARTQLHNLDPIPDPHSAMQSAQQSAQQSIPPASGPQRYSFSRLSGVFTPASSARRRASSHSQAEARALGTLIHGVLERLDFGKPESLTTKSIAELCQFSAQLNAPHHAKEAARLAPEMVTYFVSSPRGTELGTAQVLQKEIEFLLPWPDPLGSPEPSSNAAPRYFQGYLDCLYKDRQGRWKLLDYKSNRIESDEERERLVDHYAMQMYLYQKACESALGVSIDEATLCFLADKSEHTYEFDEQASEEVRNRIESTIAMLNLDTLTP